MKVLLLTGPSPATLFGQAPLAFALRNQGHEVIMATTEEMVPVAEKLAIPFVAVTDRQLESLVWTDRSGNPVPRPQNLPDEVRVGANMFGRLAAACLDDLLALSERWRPDLVVGGSCSYAAPLLKAHLDVPYVHQAWDTLDYAKFLPHATEELTPELTALGLDALPAPDLYIDICPPSLRPPSAPDATMMRWVPCNMQRRLEPWMLTKGDKPRVCVTWGTRVEMMGTHEFLRGLAEGVAATGAEILVAAPEEAAPKLRQQLPGLQVGWMPLDVLAPTCDLIVHHGGVTGLIAMYFGVPQLSVPEFMAFRESWQRVADFGASINLQPDVMTAESIAAACNELLTGEVYREKARELSRQIAGMPDAAPAVSAIERLGADAGKAMAAS